MPGNSGRISVSYFLNFQSALEFLTLLLLVGALLQLKRSFVTAFVLLLSAVVFNTIIEPIVLELLYWQNLDRIFDGSFALNLIPFRSLFSLPDNFQYLATNNFALNLLLFSILSMAIMKVTALAATILFARLLFQIRKIRQKSAFAAQPGISYPNKSFGVFHEQSANSNLVIALPGYSQGPLNLIQLRQMATLGNINSSTPLKDPTSGNIFPAKAVPGIFSRRDYVTALLLSIFLGGLGIDRFYLGHTGLGIAKLLTAGGCGVWSLIDLILIAMRKVNDYEGMPLG
jgi:hypothetical protein